jgi:galactose mutarotase-like enzyme
VPALGAKIVSLFDRRSGREWLWAPGPERTLFANPPGEAFTASPHVGIDECFPTIGRCRWQGESLDDHGSLWTTAWSVDPLAWNAGVLTTEAEVRIPALNFTRTLTLRENRVDFRYRVANRTKFRQPWGWSFHPLLAFAPGDVIDLPSEVKILRVESSRGESGVSTGDALPWPGRRGDADLGRLAWGDSASSYLKAFAGPLATEGFAALRNERSRESLSFRWEARMNPYLGLWLTRGGYRGGHHVALEPCNLACDALTDSAGQPRTGRWLEPSGIEEWTMELAAEA